MTRRKRKRKLKRYSTETKKMIARYYSNIEYGYKHLVLEAWDVSRRVVLRWIRGECLGEPGRPKRQA